MAHCKNALLNCILAVGKSEQNPSLDPFGQQWYDGYSGDSKGTLCISKKFTTQVNSEPRDVVAKLWILPHPDARDGRKEIKPNGDHAENASIIKLQGTYIYRNRRLIHFAHGDRPWSEMMKPQDHLVYSRAEILPPASQMKCESSPLTHLKRRLILENLRKIFVIGRRNLERSGTLKIQ